jgi:hypothetical protein
MLFSTHYSSPFSGLDISRSAHLETLWIGILIAGKCKFSDSGGGFLLKVTVSRYEYFFKV